MFAYLPPGELLQEPPVEFGLAKLRGPVLEGVGIGVVKGQHKEQKGLLCELPVVQCDICGERAHAAFGQRNGIELLPHLKPSADLILIEGFQPHGHSTLRNPGAIDDRNAAGNDDGQWPTLVCLSLLKGLHAQQKVGLRNAGGLQQLIKTIEHHDRQRTVTRFNKLRPPKSFPGNVTDGELDLM